MVVTTERWTNGVLTSILLRVGSSGGGLPDALQVFGFAGRRYLRHLWRIPNPFGALLLRFCMLRKWLDFGQRSN